MPLITPGRPPIFSWPLGFSIRYAINVADEEGVGVPETEDGRHFCPRYHFKGLYNLNCDGHHSYCTMTQGEIGRMTKWNNHFCTEDLPPPVTVVNTEQYGGGTSVAGSASL